MQFIRLEYEKDNAINIRLFRYVLDSEGAYYIMQAPSYLIDKDNYNEEVKYIYQKVGYTLNDVLVVDYNEQDNIEEYGVLKNI